MFWFITLPATNELLRPPIHRSDGSEVEATPGGPEWGKLVDPVFVVLKGFGAPENERMGPEN